MPSPARGSPFHSLGGRETPVTDFDFDKPYGPNWKRKLGIAAGTAVNALAVLAHTTLFVMSLAVLWGWYFIGVVRCLVLVATAIDRQVRVRQLARRQSYWRGSERIALVYFSILVVISLCVNLAFLVLYLLGDYRPLFGDIPFR